MNMEELARLGQKLEDDERARKMLAEAENERKRADEAQKWIEAFRHESGLDAESFALLKAEYHDGSVRVLHLGMSYRFK